MSLSDDSICCAMLCDSGVRMFLPFQVTAETRFDSVAAVDVSEAMHVLTPVWWHETKQTACSKGAAGHDLQLVVI